VQKSILPKLYFILLLIFFSYPLFADNTTDIDSRFTLHINQEALEHLHIIQLKSSQQQAEQHSIASKVNIQPLLQQRQHYLSILSQQKIATIQLKQIESSIQRLKKLQHNKIISPKQRQQQETQKALYQAEINQLQLQQENLYQQTQLLWGTKISHWFLSEHHSTFQKLSNASHSLYKLHLSDEHTNAPHTLFIHALNIRQQAHAAQLISNAPSNNQTLAKPAFFYLSADANLHQSRVHAWLPLAQHKTGVIIPRSAIVWHLGERYVYLQNQENKAYFQRHRIHQPQALDKQSYFSSDLQAGQNLVTTGAQLLLSEEFRSQIPAEDDDDDDD